MKEIKHINLAGQAITLNMDAYERLDHYLSLLEDHFTRSSAGDEILEGIESRIYELLVEDRDTSKIITLRAVDEAIRQMGNPSDLTGVDADDWAYYRQERSGYDGRTIHTGRRLMRDPDNEVIAGVCSGLSAYFGIDDPIWIRLLFALGLAIFGSGVLLYIVLWIAMPAARTASDRLAMQGERIDIENIARNITDEVEDLAERLSGRMDR